MIFSDKELWRWMESVGYHPERIADLPAIAGPLPEGIGLESTEERPFEDLEKIEMRMAWIPRKYREQLIFCGFHYCNFFARIWAPLVPLVQDLVYMEWLSHVEPDYRNYRDHLVHMWKVAFVGMKLLEDRAIFHEISGLQFSDVKNGPFYEWATQQGFAFCDTSSRVGSEDASIRRRRIIKYAYLFAALFHDFGYAYQFRFYLDKHVGQLIKWASTLTQNSEPTCEAQELFRKSLAGRFALTAMGMKPSEDGQEPDPTRCRQTGFIRDHLHLNHSMASCLSILHRIKCLNDRRLLHPDMRLALEIAAEAVMIHDMVGEKNRCGCAEPFPPEKSTPPIVQLLMLADELAIWNRPRLEPDPDCDDQEIMLCFNSITIRSISVDHTNQELKIRLSGIRKRELRDLKKNLCLRKFSKKGVRKKFFKSWFLDQSIRLYKR